MTLRCDMCHKVLKPDAKRYLVVPSLRPDLTLTVGPECYRKSVKARKQYEARLAAGHVFPNLVPTR